MGQDRANIQRFTHAQPSGVVEADRYVRFHHGNSSIDETQTDPAWWDDVRDAARGTDAGAWSSAVSTVAASVSFSWSSDWTAALRKAFRD